MVSNLVVTADVNGFYRLDPYGRALREIRLLMVKSLALTTDMM